MTLPTLSDAERYVGRAYVEGEFDCASLAVLVQRELFGREIALPAAADRARGRRGQARDIRAFQPTLADPIDAPQTGAAVIFWQHTAQGVPPLNRLWHVGTVFVQAGEAWVLHCANEAQGVVLQRLDQMLRHGQHLDGFYAWHDEPKHLELAIAAHPLMGQVETRTTPAGRTLAETLAAEGVTGSGWTVTVGGLAVPPAMWSRMRVKPGHLIEAHAVVRKQALKIIAIVVLSYFTFGAGGLGAGGLFAAGGAIGGGFLAAAAVYVGGSMMINKLLTPKASSAGDQSANQPPPTYALQGGRNRARPYEPLALVLGETKAVPDNANQPFTWFEGDDQYLSTMFHAGINCGTVSDIRLGDTVIEAYDGAAVTRYGFPDGNSAQPPILGTSVDSVQGGLLDAPTAPGPWVTRTTSAGTVQIAVDLEMSLSSMNGKGNYEAISVWVEVQARQIDGFGGAWYALAVPQFSNNGSKPVRRTLSYTMPTPGQYEIRLRKLDINASAVGASNTVSWAALKSYQSDTADYGSQPRVNLQLKASGQLSGAPDEVNWIARAAAMPYWNGSQWVTATEPGAAGLSNPGAQILMLLRGLYRASDGRLIAGAGLSDARIDIESLKGFMVRCAAKGFRFDALIQEAMNLQDLLESIAAAGLGSLSRHSGRIGVVWMAEDQPIEGVVNMASMKARSFTVQYDLMATADEYQLEFFDAERGWSWQPVRVQAPGTVTPQRTSTENVRGVTRAAHAAVMARFAMGQNIYGRKSISFEMDLEHLVYRRGAVLSLSHDLTQWGYGGRVVAVTTAAGAFTVEVDEPVPTVQQPGRTLGLRLVGEQQMRVFNVASVSVDGRVLSIAQAWPASAALPGVGGAAHDALWMYDFKATPGYRVRVTSIEPGDNMGGAQVTVVPESPEFWNYVLNGTYVPPPNNSSLAQDLPVAMNLRVTRARVRQGEGWGHELTATFDVVGRFDHAQLWAAPAGSALAQIGGPVHGTQVTWAVPSDQVWTVEIRPFDPLGRMGTRVSVNFVDPAEVVAGVTAFTVTVEATGVVARWNAPQGLDAVAWAVTQIREGTTWETASPIFEGRVDSASLGWLAAGAHIFWAAHRNSAGDWSAPVAAAIQIDAPSQPVVTGEAWRDQVELGWQECTTTQPLRGYEIRVGDIFDQAAVLSFVNGLGYVRTESEPATRLYWVTAVDLAGNRGAPGYKSVTTLPGITEALDELQEGLDGVLEKIDGLETYEGKWGVRVVDADGKKVSGIILNNDGEQSDFIVLADRFAWASEINGEVKYPVVFGQINGEASFGFAGNMFLDGVLKTRMLEAEAVTADKIRAKSITADQIKAGAITADVVNVGTGRNMLPNASFTASLDYFGTADTIGGQVFGIDVAGADWKLPNYGTATIQQPNASYAGQDKNLRYGEIYSTEIPVLPGSRYEFSIYTAAHRCEVYAVVGYKDAVGAWISTGYVETNTNNEQANGGRVLSAFKRISCFSVAPQNAANAVVILRKGPTKPGQANSYGFFTLGFFGEATASQTVLSAWSSSGQGVKITASGISTPSISAISANLGTITAGQINLQGTDGTASFVRTNSKWYGDGQWGFVIARETNGVVFLDFKAGPCTMWMHSDGSAGWQSPGITMSNGGLTISQANVINTLNVAGGAVAFSEWTQGNMNAAMGISVPSGVIFRVLLVAHFAGALGHAAGTRGNVVDCSLTGVAPSTVLIQSYAAGDSEGGTNYGSVRSPQTMTSLIDLGPGYHTLSASMTQLGGMSCLITLTASIVKRPQ
ncbi:host specificity factor TipJ family phage tail protein [Variovorax sp. UMC13]|uniref:host specificity factor TipJ family phage tail protein n=1 Tax=Variovorax sp. UMC13 TaxID=1862326 RepID=UPI001601317B|nr:host specificity factor TipJ family phage tail protein [Variovorax sp. UMC13]MBB1603308.1 hypothetical protein [Variovorax sp. UMC13]